MRIWGKVIKDNRIVLDDVATSDMEDIDYDEALKDCMNELCSKFDMAKPYWLDSNVREYNKRKKTTFNQDNFIEEIDFDKFIIEELEDDYR